MKRSTQSIGILYLVLTILLFSTFEVTSKFLSPHMGPTQITFYRFFIGGFVLLPFALIQIKKKKVKLTFLDFIKFSALGIVNIVISMGLIQLGLVYTNASVCAVLFSINPLFVMFFARIMLDEKITITKVIGLLLGVIGIVTLFMDSISKKTSTVLGLVLILVSSICFAFYTVLGKKIITNKIDSLIVTTFSFLIGSGVLIPIQVGMNIPLLPDVSKVIPQLLYMSIIVTGLAYVTYFEGLSRLEAGAGSMLYFAKPALASILATCILHEKISINLVFGIVIIAFGIFIAQLKLPGNNFLKNNDKGLR
jgi:drug/metabolite transporter (DMT)-like permease